MRLPSFGVVAVLLSASVALADGCYIPERAVRKIPEIPSQRALLSWKDGVETLVISSALDSEAQRLGWIIPIPATPTKIEKESPGGLKTLSFCLQPKITHDLHQMTVASVVELIVVNLIGATLLFKRKRLVALLLLLFVLLLLWTSLLTAGGTIGVAAARTDKSLVEKTATVGSYVVSVLRPSRPGDLNVWLGDNGFAALPAAADKTVADYIAQGWVFAAIKLRRAESGANTPHPIKMVFPAKEAVYPLKLTAIAGGSPHLELFVVADDTAACNVLSEEFCDRFTLARGFQEPQYTIEDSFHGTTSECNVGHPAIRPLMWNDCVLTKLSGTVRANDMNEDIRFDWKPCHPYRQHFYTASGARSVAWLLFIWAVGSWGILSMYVYRKRIVQPRGRRWYFGRVLLPAIVLSAAGAGILLVSLPKLDASEVEVSRGRHHDDFLLIVAKNFLEEHPDILQGSGQEIADSILTYLGKGWKTKPEFKVEDTPGNFTVEKQPGKVIVRAYDRDGTVSFSEYPAPSPRGVPKDGRDKR